MCIHPKTYRKLAVRVGTFFAMLFVLCFVWALVRGGGADLQTYHLTALQWSFWGFTGYNAVSFVAGLVQSFVWGVIAVGVWRLAGICCGTSESSKDGGESHEHKEGGACCK